VQLGREGRVRRRGEAPDRRPRRRPPEGREAHARVDLAAAVPRRHAGPRPDHPDPPRGGAPTECRRILESDSLAHVTTIDPDGRPQTTLAWVGLEGDEVVFATLPDQRQPRNLGRARGNSY